MRHTGGGRTTEGETEMALEHAQPLGSAGVREGDVTNALAEGPPRTGWVRTAEASQPEAQRTDRPCQGKSARVRSQ